MVHWINKNDLEEALRKTGKQYRHTDFCGFSFNSNSLRKFIPQEDDEEVIEFTDPSPCLKWYGRGPFFFQLTAYLNDGINEFSIVSLLQTEPVETDWEILKDLDFPFNFVENITFIQGIQNSPYALYSVDEDNLTFELYRGKSEKDAESLQKFLIDHDFNRQLFIDKSEILPADWLAFEGEKNIARYGNKYATERFALQRSKLNNSVITVYSPDIPDSTIIFENGIKQI